MASKKVPPQTTAPSCPKCGDPMVKRTNHTTGQEFWGCAKFPACRGSRNLDGSHGRRSGRLGLVRATGTYVGESDDYDPDIAFDRDWADSGDLGYWGSD